MKKYNILKLIAILGLFFSAVFFLIGLYLAKIKQPKKHYKAQDVVYVDKDNNIIKKDVKVINNICKNNRWKKFSIVENKSNYHEILIFNEQLFKTKLTQEETIGRHKGEVSISLLELYPSNDFDLIIKLCDDTNVTYTTNDINKKNLRLVMNSKGALKLISTQNEVVKTIHKYLYSIRQNNDFQ